MSGPTARRPRARRLVEEDRVRVAHRDRGRRGASRRRPRSPASPSSARRPHLDGDRPRPRRRAAAVHACSAFGPESVSMTRSPVEPARLGEVAGEAADAVPAHRRDRAVGVVDVHRGGGAGRARRQDRRGRRPRRRRGGGRRGAARARRPTSGPSTTHEVVAEAVVLREPERHGRTIPRPRPGVGPPPALCYGRPAWTSSRSSGPSSPPTRPPRARTCRCSICSSGRRGRSGSTPAATRGPTRTGW